MHACSSRSSRRGCFPWMGSRARCSLSFAPPSVSPDAATGLATAEPSTGDAWSARCRLPPPGRGAAAAIAAAEAFPIPPPTCVQFRIYFQLCLLAHARSPLRLLCPASVFPLPLHLSLIFVPVYPCVCGVVGRRSARVVSLSPPVGSLLKDVDFRRGLRAKCAACLAPAAAGDDNDMAACPVLSIERLAGDGSAVAQAPRDAKIRSLRSPTRLLNVVASLHLPRPGVGDGGGGRTCGVPNSYLACAELYLAVVYKMECNDCNAACHLMQVFADVLGLVCRDLLSDLWDHVFLSHLLHLKVWFTNKVDFVAG